MTNVLQEALRPRTWKAVPAICCLVRITPVLLPSMAKKELGIHLSFLSPFWISKESWKKQESLKVFYSHCTKCLFLAGCDVLLEAGARETWENTASCTGFSHLAACSQPAGCVRRERSLPAWLSGHLGPQKRLSWRKPKAACPFLQRQL